jgi:hypothetical protein
MAIELPFGVVDVHDPQVVVHSFGSRDAKTEQRYYMGPGARRLRVNLSTLNLARRQALIDQFEAAKGSYAPFDITYRGATLSVYFSVARLDIQSVVDSSRYSASFELIVAPPTPPSYSSSAVQTRFPDSSLQTALLDPIQEVIPLLTIIPKGNAPHYFSDRAVTVDGNSYLARLVNWDGIQQGLNSADQARFTIGNADRRYTAFVNQQDWYAADVQFALFHVGTLVKLNLWRGHIIPGGWEFDSGPDFKLTAADGAYELRLAYPPDKITRQTFVFPTDNQPVNVGKKGSITATSVVADSGFGIPVQDIWIDDEVQPLRVKCAVLAGRDESEYYAAMGVVGRGPIGEFGQLPQIASVTPVTWSWGTLDGQFNHGPGLYGIRRSLGGNPATGSETQLDNNPDQYSNRIGLDSTSAPPPADYPAPPGVAMLEIRRTDTKGIQPDNATKQHDMVAFVSKGNGGNVWSGTGPAYTRTWTQPLTNPVWVAVNVWLRGNKVGLAAQATQENYFLIPDAIAAATVCDTMTSKLVGTGTEKQFTWTGVIAEQKPLRDWLKEILSSCLGYYTFAFGKLKVGLRWHSGASEAFDVGNILFNSLTLSAASVEYNHLTATFADREYGYLSNPMEFAQADHIAAVGMDLTANINFSGVCTKSQAARVVTSLVREQVGGISADEWMKARRGRFNTTALALNVDCGTICSLVHEDMPTYAANGSIPNYGEFIVESWTLQKDYSITLEWRTTTDNMYNMIVGAKPTDVPINLPTGSIDKNPGIFTFTPALYEYGTISIENCAVSVGANRGLQSILAFPVFVDELTADVFVTLDADLDTTDPVTVAVTANPDQITTSGELAFEVWDYVLFADSGHYEISRITAISGSNWTLQRDWPGDAAPNAIFGSNRHAHAVGTKIFKCQIRKFTFNAATGDYDNITDTSSIPGRFDMDLPNTCVLAIVAAVRNGFGTSAFTVYNCALSAVPGMRTLQGGNFTFQRSGVLQLVDQAAISKRVQYKSSIRVCYATVDDAPTGAAAIVKVQRMASGTSAWSDIATLTIADGDLVSWGAYPPGDQRIPYDGVWPPAILYPEDQLNYSITQIGSTTAGANLTVEVFT